MLDVMEKYGPMEKLEHLRLRNLSMGSLLIILPFAPNLRTLSLRYNAARGGTAAASDESAAPNLTDDLFVKIFQRNQGRKIHSGISQTFSYRIALGPRFLLITTETITYAIDDPDNEKSTTCTVIISYRNP